MTTLFELAARIQAAGGAGSMMLMLLKATLILAVARVLLAVLPRASAATRHLVATAALVGVAAIPVLTFVVPAWNLVVAPAPTVAAPVAAPVATATPTPTPTSQPQQQATKTIGVTGEETIGTAINLARATGVVPEEPLTAMTRGMNVFRSTWKGLIVLAIDAIALLMLGQMIIGMLGVWYVARRAEEVTQDEALVELDRARDQLALQRDVRLLRSSRISVPVLWGFFNRCSCCLPKS